MRAHPDESWIRSKVVVRMGEVAAELAGGAPNVLVIGGDEDVSSYALMPGLSGGLVWISSIGVDMIARGIPVLAAARPKYHPLQLVQEPATVPDYFESLSRLAAAPAHPTPDQQARARALPEPRLLRVLVPGVQPVLPRAGPLPDRSRQPA